MMGGRESNLGNTLEEKKLIFTNRSRRKFSSTSLRLRRHRGGA
jgi:hypothetical protein